MENIHQIRIRRCEAFILCFQTQTHFQFHVVLRKSSKQALFDKLSAWPIGETETFVFSKIKHTVLTNTDTSSIKKSFIKIDICEKSK